VEVAGKTLLEVTLRRLASFGVRDVIVNVHHFADRVVEYLKKNDNFGMRVEISREEVLLDTGGGLKKARWFFAEDGDPFILHNVDVVSTIDLGRMVRFHEEKRALATVAVQQRETSRYLLFDRDGRLRGRRTGTRGELAQGPEEMLALAFSGVHVISPQLLGMMSEEGAFSIIEAYLRLVGQGESILAFRADEYYWRDLGKHENVLQAGKDAESGVITL